VKAFPEIEGIAFGLVDGIVLALGLIIGVWAATHDPGTIILAALIGGVANAFGNAAGVFLSQTAERGVQLRKKDHNAAADVHSKQEVIAISLFAFASSVLSVIVIILPFYALDVFQATTVSLVISLVMLFALGRYVGGLSKRNPLKYGLMYVVIGLLAAGIAYLVGEGLKGLLL